MTCPNCGTLTGKEVVVRKVRCYIGVVQPDNTIKEVESDYPGSTYEEIICAECGEIVEEKDL